MTYGLQVTRANGGVIVNQTMPGGRVFVSKIVRARESAGVVTTYTFNNVASGTHLRVMQAGAGAHSWTTGTSGGAATVTLTSINSAVGRSATTTLYVFATQTLEPDYGIETQNDSGERTVSTIYPCPEFLGKVTFSNTPSNSEDMEEGGYWRFNHNSTTSLGSGRNRVVLWKLPDNSGDCWFTGTNFIEASVTGSYTVSASYIRQTSSSFTMPEAYIFALDGLVGSADTYGCRVFGPTGTLLFDAGLHHMIIKGYEASVDYSTTPNGTSTHTSLDFLSGTPAFFVPHYRQETWTNNGVVSQGKFYTGCVRKVGTTLNTKLLRTGKDIDDALLGITYQFGKSSDIVQVSVDSTIYD